MRFPYFRQTHRSTHWVSWSRPKTWHPVPRSIKTCQRPYCVEHTGSHPNSEVKRHKARIVLGWVTAREVLWVLLAFLARLFPVQNISAVGSRNTGCLLLSAIHPQIICCSALRPPSLCWRCRRPITYCLMPLAVASCYESVLSFFFCGERIFWNCLAAKYLSSRTPDLILSSNHSGWSRRSLLTLLSWPPSVEKLETS